MWFIVWWEKNPNKTKKGERKKSKGMKKEIASILTWELTFIRKASHLQATRCFSISVEMRLVFLWLPENKVNNVYDSLDAWVSRVVEMSMNKISIGWKKHFSVFSSRIAAAKILWFHPNAYWWLV